MCGIAGIWLKSEKDTLRRKLRAICDAQAHRGPDDEGYTLIEGKSHASFKGDASPAEIEMNHVDSAKDQYQIGLGHRRLSVIDTSINSHQPFSVSDYHLVFNGAIYNFKELRNELMAKGHVFTSEGDTEVVLRSYLEWGEDCVQHFNGMWAFVIFDPQKNRFFGARDITGVKPLYYTNNASQFAFASEIKALIKCQEKPEINVYHDKHLSQVFPGI
jgi:asparagine synthase (glutamine-hydrolysing)